MLFQDITRSFTLFAVLQAVKKCDDPMYFLRLLNRPEHLKPKPGEKTPKKQGEAFEAEVKQQAREESQYECVFCAEKTSTSKKVILSARSTIDHAIPKSKGGSGNINNAQNTCHECNNEKADLTTHEYLVEKFGPKGLRLIRRA